MSIILKEAQSGDITSIARLIISNWQNSYKGLLPSDFLNRLDSDYGKDKWSTFLNQDEHQIFVSYESNTFLGFGALHRDDEISDCLYLASLHISKESRGKGILYNEIQSVASPGRLVKIKMNHQSVNFSDDEWEDRFWIV